MLNCFKCRKWPDHCQCTQEEKNEYWDKMRMRLLSEAEERQRIYEEKKQVPDGPARIIKVFRGKIV